MNSTITAEQTAVADADRAFGIDLYGQIATSAGNLALSPYSVASALQMTAYGAVGRTADELIGILHLGGIERAKLGRRQAAERMKQLPDIDLAVADAVWLQSGLRLREEFLTAVYDGPDAELRHADFRRAPDQARLDINKSVETVTRGHITDLLAPGTVNALTRLVLTNAIYLKAPWATPFAERATAPGVFHRADRSTVMVPMMHATEPYGYARTDAGEVIQLPYVNGQLVMTILLPAGPLEDLERHIGAVGLRALLESTHRVHLELTMPRFRVRTNRVLNGDLQALGIRAAFDAEHADFRGITEDEPLVISHVVHETYVDVDEKGTEAAAATAVGMRVVSMPAVAAQVVVDRPFMFGIIDTATWLPLFLGRVADPSSG